MNAVSVSADGIADNIVGSAVNGSPARNSVLSFAQCDAGTQQALRNSAVPIAESQMLIFPYSERMDRDAFVHYEVELKNYDKKVCV